MNPPIVIGLGEILWDLLPSSRQLGGAPANFAYCSQLLGNRGIIASRVGRDQLGQDIRATLERNGLNHQFLQSDDATPTGTVRVQVDPAGQPKFEITQPAAWDYLEWTESWRELANSAGAVCFGTLAQRSAKSKKTISDFLNATRPETLRICDVNLRQKFYSAEVIRESFGRANAVKLNHEEEPQVKEILSITGDSDLSFCQSLIRQFELRWVCVTRGAHGSLLCSPGDAHEHAGYRVKVKDTIGSGDAFTAGLVFEYLRHRPLSEMNETANRMGAWVASHSGAMPPEPEGGLEPTLKKLF
jgi:fructokinase